MIESQAGWEWIFFFFIERLQWWYFVSIVGITNSSMITRESERGEKEDQRNTSGPRGSNVGGVHLVRACVVGRCFRVFLIFTRGKIF